MVIVIFALSVTIYEIFVNQIKCLKFDLKLKVKVRRKTRLEPFKRKYSILYWCFFLRF